MEAYGETVVNDLSLGRHLTVSTFIRDGVWNFPQATTHDLLDIFQVASELIIPFVEFEDEVVWKKTDNGQFTINSCFTSILVPNQFDWVKIWFIGRVGKHFISAWMAIINGLKTKDVPSHRNVHTDSLCVLCCRNLKL